MTDATGESRTNLTAKWLVILIVLLLLLSGLWWWQYQPSKVPGTVRLDVPQDLVDTLYRWQVVRFGNPSQVIQDLSRDTRSTIVPPGDYQITSLVQGTGNWVTWPQKIQVQPGQQATFTVNSSLRLEVPQELVSSLYRWQVVRFGNPSQVIQDLDRDHRTTILPEGDYQITSLGQGTSNWLTWPQKVGVQSGKESTTILDSGIRVNGPGATGSEFEVKDATGRAIESWRDTSVELLPPGRYTLVARPSPSNEWKNVGDFVAKSGGLTEVAIPAFH